MLPAIHLQNDIEWDEVPVIFVHFLNDQVQLTKHIPVGSLKFCTKYQETQDIPVIETN